MKIRLPRQDRAASIVRKVQEIGGTVASDQTLTCEICNTQYDSGLPRCPACDAKRQGAGGNAYKAEPKVASASSASATQGDATPAPTYRGSYSRPKTAPYSNLRSSAQSVLSLSGRVVTLAVVVGTLSVVGGGILILLAVIGSGAANEVRAVLALLGILTVLAGLVQALLLSLLGRYTAMKAEKILSDQ